MFRYGAYCFVLFAVGVIVALVGDVADQTLKTVVSCQFSVITVQLATRQLTTVSYPSHTNASKTRTSTKPSWRYKSTARWLASVTVSDSRLNLRLRSELQVQAIKVLANTPGDDIPGQGRPA